MKPGMMSSSASGTVGFPVFMNHCTEISIPPISLIAVPGHWALALHVHQETYGPHDLEVSKPVPGHSDQGTFWDNVGTSEPCEAFIHP